MKKEQFEKLNNEDKLTFYDTKITSLRSELENYENNPFRMFGEDPEVKSKQLQRKIDNLHADRRLVLDRLALGLSKNTSTKKAIRCLLLVGLILLLMEALLQ